MGDSLEEVRIKPAAPIIRTKQVARKLDGQHVEVLVMGYTDRIMITVSMEGKIGPLVLLLRSVLKHRFRSPFRIPFPSQKFSTKRTNILK
jgi:hypothetical protein